MKKGFTVLELVVVLVVGCMLGASVYCYEKSKKSCEQKEIEEEIFVATGYFIDDRKIIDCKLIDTRKDEVKVEYNSYFSYSAYYDTYDYQHAYLETKWLPAKDYYKYFTSLEELSREINELKAKVGEGL